MKKNKFISNRVKISEGKGGTIIAQNIENFII